MFIEIISFQFSGGLSLLRTNKYQEIQLLLISLCMLSELLNVWRMGWKIPYENKWWKTRDSVHSLPPDVSSGVLVNVVIVCNLKRPSDHQPAIPAETGDSGSAERAEQRLTQRQRQRILLSQHISSPNLWVIMFWKHWYKYFSEKSLLVSVGLVWNSVDRKI